MNILVVDDRISCIVDLSQILQAAGYAVIGAANGVEALKILRSQPIDLVISDILMPGMDGYSLCRELRQDAALKQIPFVIHTATYTGAQDEDLAMRTGANAFLLKPCVPDELLQLVKRLLYSKESSPAHSPVVPCDTQEVLELYNQRLVRKLEQKMLELEEEIQQHKGTLAALQVSESLLKTAQEIGKMGGWSFDAKTKSMFWTQQMYQIHDLEPGSADMETLLHSTINCVEESHRESLLQMRDELLKTGQGYQYESWFITHKNNKKYIRFTAQAIKENGEITGAQGILQDLSEYKYIQEEQEQLTAQLQRVQKLDSIGLLAGGVAHDFNNLLTVILGYADEILQKLHPQDPIYRDLQEILNAGARASTLARQLLTFSRKQKIAPEYVSINEIVQNLSKMLARILSENIEIELKLTDDPGLIFADVGHLEQVLVNLAINARDAMPQGGRLKIESFRMDANTHFVAQHPTITAGPYVALRVSDTGVGIRKEHLAQLFEPFFTTKERGQGTGLGLPTVYGIIRQANGYITVNSELGIGTSIIILLPLAQGEAETKASSAVKDSKSQNDELILILEDDPTILDLTAKMAAKSGYRVSTVQSADKALQMILEQGLKPDLVIADVVMPGMNGLEFANILSKKCPEIRILMMSGYAENVLNRLGTRNPELPFLQKPFTRKDLLLSIRGALDD